MARIVRRFGRVLLDTTVVLVVLALLPGIPPHITYTSYELDEVRPLEGPLALNHKLDSVERLLDGRIVGPESIASRKDNEVFVSLHGGKILRIWGELFDHYQSVTAIGPGCEGPWQEHICGRPLGLRFAPDGKLLVADSYLGLFAVDVNTGEKERLFDPLQEIDGVAPKLIDDLDIDSDGNVYWSDASSVADLANGVLEMMSDPSGRLIKFNPSTKSNTVLLKNIHFANGVQLSPDHDFVLVSETFKNRVLRHWLKGPKTGTTDVFVDRLPGMPDNLRSKDNGYYISLVSIKNTEKIDVHNFLAKLPFIRKAIVRFIYIVKLGFDWISNLYPNQLTEKISYNIFHLEPIAQSLSGNLSIVVEVDSEGTIVDSLQGNSGNIRFISEAKQVGDNIFFGSPYNKFLGRLYTGIPSMEVDGKGVRMKTVDEAQVETEKLIPEAQLETEKASPEALKETDKATSVEQVEIEKAKQEIEVESLTEERPSDPEIQITSPLEDLPRESIEEDSVEDPKEDTLNEQRVVIEGEVKPGVPEDIKPQENVPQVNIVKEDVDVESTKDEEGQQQIHVESEEDNDREKTSKRDEL